MNLEKELEKKMKRLLMFVSIVMPLFLCAGGVVINEVVSSNSASIFDEDGDASDWIELYNDSTASISLESFYLSDDPDEITKWQFGSAVIGPGQYLIVFAS
ncbi:MAG: lamin tail domain-containing protein, partial [Candidatus Neomarinimicrobiota bacterium]